jgi:hypothetical protein
MGVGHGANSHLHKNTLVTICLEEPWTWAVYLDKLPKLRKINMRFGT